MDRQAESKALEEEYVHNVYRQIAPHFSDTRYKAWPKVQDFLNTLEPGSVIADVGCGNGKYLGINQSVFCIGSDRCQELTAIGRHKGHEVMACDNLHLPYRDDAFDAVISIAVIHHFATLERRVQAIKELARVTQIGGKIMIYVWALEQTQRKFQSQDVLVPWHLHPKYRKKKTPSGKSVDVSSLSSLDEDDSPEEITGIANSDVFTSDTKGKKEITENCQKIQDWCSMNEKLLKSSPRRKVGNCLSKSSDVDSNDNDLFLSSTMSCDKTDGTTTSCFGGTAKTSARSKFRNLVAKIFPSLQTVSNTPHSSVGSRNKDEMNNIIKAVSCYPDLSRYTVDDKFAVREFPQSSINPQLPLLTESAIEVPTNNTVRDNNIAVGVEKAKASTESNSIAHKDDHEAEKIKHNNMKCNTYSNTKEESTPDTSKNPELLLKKIHDDETFTTRNSNILRSPSNDSGLHMAKFKDTHSVIKLSASASIDSGVISIPRSLSDWSLKQDVKTTLVCDVLEESDTSSDTTPVPNDEFACDVDMTDTTLEEKSDSTEFSTTDNTVECAELKSINDETTFLGISNDMPRLTMDKSIGCENGPTYQRYYHVFKEGELVDLIENHVDDLHIVHSYFDHSNWCVIAEKVQVWSI